MVIVGIASLSSRGAVARFEKPGIDQRFGVSDMTRAKNSLPRLLRTHWGNAKLALNLAMLRI
jgi:hypothetical protein